MGRFCVQKHPTNLTNHRYLKDNRRNDTLPFPSNIPPITIQTNTLYFDDLRIDNWSSFLRSPILSISTIHIDKPNILQSYRSANVNNHNNYNSTGRHTEAEGCLMLCKHSQISLERQNLQVLFPK